MYSLLKYTKRSFFVIGWKLSQRACELAFVMSRKEAWDLWTLNKYVHQKRYNCTKLSFIRKLHLLLPFMLLEYVQTKENLQETRITRDCRWRNKSQDNLTGIWLVQYCLSSYNLRWKIESFAFCTELGFGCIDSCLANYECWPQPFPGPNLSR